MLTRCPHCRTVFRVTTEQLKARWGKVRCGSCSTVFDAFESLADELPCVPQPLAPAVFESAAEFSALSPQITTIDFVTDFPAQAEPEPEFVAIAEAEATPEYEPEPEPQPEPEPEPSAPDISEESRRWQGGAETAAAIELEEVGAVESPPTEPEQKQPPPSWGSVPETKEPRRWPWVIGILAALLLALGQLVFIFRVELAVHTPELHPALQAGCGLFGCTVPRPRQPELVGIESSDLAPAGEHRLLLTALLRNRAPYAQEYPSLELTLTDTQDDALLRKVLPPAEYLPAGKTAAAGFAARGELAVSLTLETQDIPAIGYRLYLFYP